ncbi:MAG TPA: hypothetical protein VFB62_16700, partial [Polyangiaceae bacterium]|nr:hypothetical protein [Polyangiaceae bacterium]
MALSIVLPLVAQLWDKSRLSEEQKARSWNVATWGCALYALGPLSMLGWIQVTRDGFKRCLLAPLWTVPLLLLMWVADALVAKEVDWNEPLQLIVVGAPAIAVVMLFVELITRTWRTVKRRSPTLRRILSLLVLSFFLGDAPDAFAGLPPGSEGWSGRGAVRGLTVGPIENALHPEAGYGTDAGRAAIAEARALGANWVALTPFGRVWDLRGGGVDLTFEEPVEQNSIDVLEAMRVAHEQGLSVFLVPHLWVETGGWRALINPESEEGWARWAESYRHFVLHWAEIAELGDAEMFSVGVELRSWTTTKRAPTFASIIADVRARYDGLLTYSANWDDVEHTVIWGDLDVIGVNAFYPLTDKESASWEDLAAGGQRVAAGLGALARAWQKPVLLTEMGYTTRADPALKPWEWPDGMRDVQIDQQAQALAYRALLAPFLDQAWCVGFFAWRTYADPHDVSQEAEWGFSPRGKLAELVLRDAYAARWATDGDGWLGWAGAHR